MALMEEYLDAHLNLNGASEYSKNKIRYGIPNLINN
jgi:hypothetical protein